MVESQWRSSHYLNALRNAAGAAPVLCPKFVPARDVQSRVGRSAMFDFSRMYSIRHSVFPRAALVQNRFVRRAPSGDVDDPLTKAATADWLSTKGRRFGANREYNRWLRMPLVLRRTSRR